MSFLERRSFSRGLIAGAALITACVLLLGQNANQPVKSESQYFVTGEGDEAHLWVREGVKLRCLGHGECAAHKHEDHDHKDGEGPDRGKETPKK